MAWEARSPWKVWAKKFCVSYRTSSAVMQDGLIVNAMLSSVRSKDLELSNGKFSSCDVSPWWLKGIAAK